MIVWHCPEKRLHEPIFLLSVHYGPLNVSYLKVREEAYSRIFYLYLAHHTFQDIMAASSHLNIILMYIYQLLSFVKITMEIVKYNW